jgi:Protein of unknown function (DUF1573)
MKTLKIFVLVLSLTMMSFGVLPKPILKSIIYLTTAPITWKSDTIDVGEIPQGTPKVINYEFTNTSEKSILITNVQGSCGCTTTNYTKEPIAPGKTANINTTYNAANKGAFAKTVTVTTSAEATPKVLSFKGLVIETISSK